MIDFIEIFNSFCKQDQENKLEDNAQQSSDDTQAAEPILNQLERNKMYLASASYDETIKIWDLETYQCLKTLEGHDGKVLIFRQLNCETKFVILKKILNL